jgi:hypothetical protein
VLAIATFQVRCDDVIGEPEAFYPSAAPGPASTTAHVTRAFAGLRSVGSCYVDRVAVLISEDVSGA